MKTLILIALILSVAYCQFTCPDQFSNDQTCFQGYTIISGCKIYGDPLTCSECLPGLSPNTAKTACEASSAYVGWVRFPYDSTGTNYGDSNRCLSFGYQRTIYPTTAFNYAEMSCIIEKQQVCMKCQNGSRWDDAATAKKCVACTISNCATCYLDGTTEKCSLCTGAYFVAATPITCTNCGSNAATCTSATVATKCNYGYFLASGACTACASTSTVLECTSATVATKCATGYYLDGTECKQCTQPNVKTCSANTAAGIIQCADATMTVVNYKLSVGCIQKNISDRCLKIALKTGSAATSTSGSEYVCSACWGDTYTLDAGVCNVCKSSTYSADNSGTGIEKCVNGTSATAHTLTCKSTYYKEIQTTAGANLGKCLSCATAIPNCKLCYGNASATPTCTEAAIGYALKSTDASPQSCTTGCDACTLTTGATTLANCTTLTSAGYYQAFTGTTLIKVVNLCSAVTNAKTTDAGATSLTAVADCTECTWSSTQTAHPLTAVICTKCSNTTNDRAVVIFTDGTAKTTPTTTQATKCLKIGVTSGEHPIKDDKTLRCSKVYVDVGDVGASSSTPANLKCVECTAPHYLNTANGTCDAVAVTVGTCAVGKAGGKCLTCIAGQVPDTDGSNCYTVANCVATKVTYPGSGTAAKCSECQTPTNTAGQATIYIAAFDQLSCYSCSTYTSQCIEYQTTTGVLTCQCKKCNAGYYIGADYKCTNTISLTSCAVHDPTQTATETCLICNYGYKVKDGVCTSCTTTGVTCVYTGCQNLSYITKVAVAATAAAAAANSAIVAFIISAFIALLTFLI